ncbi:alpha/beta fold hydrolase [Georgenia wangjunii]|uniref:alpha/beta fold hydrolase n=1 Tax=Georgenia wangjunii TaxID=3117730 RepID=UPI002F26244B
MATYVLLHGAGGDAWQWHRVAPLLTALGHDVVAPDLPVDDDAAGIAEYADATVDAVGRRRDVVLVAQSMAAFTAPLVVGRVPTTLLVLTAPMIPSPGESAGQWWEATGQDAAARAFAVSEGRDLDGEDEIATFLHDVPRDVVREAVARGERGQSGTPFAAPWPLAAWPDVPTRVVIGTRDRLFPPDLQRRLARERLGLVADELDAGHVIPLARPRELVDLLERYRADVVPA